MKLLVCGVGGAGCRLADRLVEADGDRNRSFVVDSVAFDTDQPVLSGLEHVPEDNRHLYGVIEAEGEGVDGNRSVGAAAASSNTTELSNAVSELTAGEASAVVCCVGLAGGSGATALPLLATEFGHVYDLPVYGVGILPAVEARAESTQAINTGRALSDLREATDSLIVFDNQLWLKSGESPEADAVRQRLNEELTTRLAALFGAGEGDHNRRIAEGVVDASEVQNTFAAGGIASIGYAVQEIDRPTTSRFGFGILTEEGDIDETTAISAIETSVRRAVRGKLTVDIARDSVSRGLLVVGGPPEWLNRQAVADARSWLAQETGSTEIRGGDMPTDVDEISMLALLTGVRSCPRVAAFQSVDTRG